MTTGAGAASRCCAGVAGAGELDRGDGKDAAGDCLQGTGTVREGE